jgi:hypothetical protein
VAAVALVPAAIAAPAPRGGENGSYGMAFTFTGGEQSFVVPEGIRTVHVRAIGGEGADAGTIQGGQGVEVQDDIPVEPGEVLYVEVGGSPSGATGGFNGGGNAGTGALAGGGGGGASDVRLEPRANAGSALSRLVVAPGGGGAGATGGQMGSAGGAGGDAGDSGAAGSGMAPPHYAGGGAGGGATGASGGGAGAAGTPDQGSNGTAGGMGQFGVGAIGGDGNAGGGPGGGGGGGYYGGGGGGGGGTDSHFTTPVPSGGGGGGGGSALVSETGTGPTLVDPGTPPRVLITYITPGTTITAGPQGVKKTKKRRISAAYRFESNQPDASFECRLDGKPFDVCQSPKRVSLGKGRHRFEVRAISAIRNTDPTPAVRKLKVVRRK